MKVGSLVVLKDRPIVIEPEPGETFPVPKVIYTVRFLSSLYPSIALEEIYNPIGWDGEEMTFNMSCFRELMPPTSISIEEILKEEITV